MGGVGHTSPPIWPCSDWGLPCHHCCQWRGGLLPHRFTLTHLAAGGLFSVALSVAFRRPGVTWQSTRWSSDFPRAPHRRPRPSCLTSVGKIAGRRGSGEAGKQPHVAASVPLSSPRLMGDSVLLMLTRCPASPLTSPRMTYPRQPLLGLLDEGLERWISLPPLRQDLAILLSRLGSAPQPLVGRSP
jgi:hypothetical protein